MFAFDHNVAARDDGRRQELPAPFTTSYDIAENRVDIQLEGGGISRLWWATKNEWLGLIDVAGLELEALYGDFDHTPLSSASREYVFVTVRR